MSTRSTVVAVVLALAASCSPASPPPTAPAPVPSGPAPAAPPATASVSADPTPSGSGEHAAPSVVDRMIVDAMARAEGRVAVSSSFSIGGQSGRAEAELVWADGVGRLHLHHDDAYLELGLAPRLSLLTRLTGVDVGVELRGPSLAAARERMAAAMAYLVAGVPMVEEAPGRWRGFPPGTGGFVAVTARAGEQGIEELTLGIAATDGSGSEQWVVGPPRPVAGR